MTAAEQTLEDGSQPLVFDVLEVRVIDTIPESRHADASRIAATTWTRNGQLKGSARRALLEEFDTAQAVFGTNEASLSLWSLVERGPPPSVAIIKPRDVMWIKGVRDERPTFDVTFEHAGARQQLPVVDKSWLARFVDAEVGQYPPSNQEDTFLVIFSEPMGDEYWKLVATVLQLPPDDSAREH